MGTIKNKPSIRTKYKDLQFAVGPFSISGLAEFYGREI